MNASSHTFTIPTYSFETTVEVQREREWDVTVTYRICAGYRATSLTPAEPETVEIVSIKGIDFEPDIYAYDRLVAEAEDDAREMADDEDYCAPVRSAWGQY